MNTDRSFRRYPGCRERHLQRKTDNPLFPRPQRSPSMAEIDQARRLDNEELVDFMAKVQVLVQRISELSGVVDSQVVLDLKGHADRYYEQSVGLPGDQGPVKQALLKLIEVMMTALEKGAADDPQALAELQREQLARETHYALLEVPLTGDLLRDPSPIAADELIPTLLSEPDGNLNRILAMFDDEQLASIDSEARSLVAQCKREGHDLTPVERRLQLIQAQLEQRGDGLNPASFIK